MMIASTVSFFFFSSYPKWLFKISASLKQLQTSCKTHTVTLPRPISHLDHQDWDFSRRTVESLHDTCSFLITFASPLEEKKQRGQLRDIELLTVV